MRQKSGGQYEKTLDKRNSPRLYRIGRSGQAPQGAEILLRIGLFKIRRPQMKIWTSLFIIWLAVNVLSGGDTLAMTLAAAVLLEITTKAIGGQHEEV
jgi:hypothetical protein